MAQTFLELFGSPIEKLQYSVFDYNNNVKKNVLKKYLKSFNFEKRMSQIA